MGSQRRIELGSGPVGENDPGFGIPALDERLGHAFWGDNVVWRMDSAASEASFPQAVYAAAKAVPAYEAVRWVTAESLAAELGRVPDRTLLLIHLKGESADFDVEACIRDVFVREIVCFWFVETEPSPAWLPLAQCIIATEGPNLRIDRADGRPLGLRGMLLPFSLEQASHEREPRLTVRRAPAGALLGRGLRRLRRERGWSQTELGALIGVSGSAISQAERGLLSLSLESVLELSGRLGVAVDALMRGPAERYTLARHPVGSGTSAAQTWDAPEIPGSRLRTVTLTIPERATARAGLVEAAPQLLLIGHGLVQALLTDDAPLLRQGDRLVATGSDLRGLRNVGDGEALVFWMSSAP